jgi:putative ATP-dependent endonuclease of OLD family
VYISRVRIEGFRCFRDISIEFAPGLNVLIGENNAGKTTVLRALALVFGGRDGLTVDDFHRPSACLEIEPRIRITVTLSSTKDEPPEHKALVVSWLTRIESPWEATLTYAFFLPQKDAESFRDELKRLRPAEKNSEDKGMSEGTLGDTSDNAHEDTSQNTYVAEYWRLVERYLPRYVARTWGGNPDAEIRAEAEWLDKISLQSLDAIRDVQARLFMGRNPMLRDILDTVLDKKAKDDEERQNARKEFDRLSRQVIDNIERRIDLDDVLRVAKQTGADVGGIPALEGSLTESDLLAALRLMIHDTSTGIALPATLNGLGYNNLVYISLVLANLQIKSSDVVGENAKVFNVLCIEEPEAHLHPALQHRFLKFLLSELETKAQNHQLFVTTHSTHITSAVDLNSIISINCANSKNITVAYPGRVFDENADDDVKSRDYVERFLDATKSTMLFCKGIVFVEGIAEQILLPCLAEYVGHSFEVSHVSVVSVNGTAFKHFLRLFGSPPGLVAKHTMPTRVACVFDLDPAHRESSVRGARWKSCWPFELNADPKHDYRQLQILTDLPTGSNIRLFYDETGKGKTFEYDLAFVNHTCELLITSACEDADLLEALMAECAKGSWFGKIEGEDERVYAALDACNWDLKDKLKARFAANYLLAIEKSKGENALILERQLRQNLRSGKQQGFIVPDHIRRAIEWVCKN